MQRMCSYVYDAAVVIYCLSQQHCQLHLLAVYSLHFHGEKKEFLKHT